MSDSRSAGPDRRLRLAVSVGVLVALHAVLAWLSREPGVLTGQDDAEYIVLAQSLLDGGYNDSFRVDSPTHRTYPPVYPAALAAWGTIAGRGFDSLVLLNVLVSAATLVLLFVVLRRLAGDALALATTTLLAINPELIRFAGGIRSEPLFTLLALSALAALRAADEVRGSDSTALQVDAKRAEARWIAIAISAALAAALTRSIGVTVIAAIGLHWLLQRRWKLVAVPAGLATAAVCAWLAWTALGGEHFVGSSYIAELRQLWNGTRWTGPLPGRAIEWSLLYLRHGVPQVLAFPTIPGTAVENVVLLALGGIVVVAGLGVLVRDWRAAALWVLVYTVLLVFWLFRVDRFLVPMAPLLVASALIGAAAIGRRIGPRAKRLVPACAATVLAAGAIAGTFRLVHERIGCDRDGRYPDPACMLEDQRSYFDALRWIEANTAEDATFLSAKPGALFLYTGRKSIAFEVSLSQPADQLIEWIRGEGADWILFDSLLFQERVLLAPLLAANCGHLRVVESFPPRAWLLRLSDADGEPGADACAAIERYRGANPIDTLNVFR